MIIIVTAYLVQPTRSDSIPSQPMVLIPLSDVERLLALPGIQRKERLVKTRPTDNRSLAYWVTTSSTTGHHEQIIAILPALIALAELRTNATNPNNLLWMWCP
ncbi:hypothetical protein O9992_22005 [Vibrio lentus]|nr:hypothetical protein [Vibrio lentus]